MSESEKNPLQCGHCKERLEESKSLDGFMLVNTHAPVTGHGSRTLLCGACALEVMEFLTPELKEDGPYVRMAAVLREAWGAS